MAHLQSQIKGGYYPLPSEHLPALASLFKASEGDGSPNRGRILDPCAGEGDALQHLAGAWGMTPYANEIDADRAKVCREKFGDERAVCGDLMTLRTPNRAYSIVYVNPPYAENSGHADEKRREFEHLSHSIKWAQAGGLVIWIVYAGHMTERAASFLVKHSSHVDIYRLPGLHLNTYPQIVVVAKVRPVERAALPEWPQATTGEVTGSRSSEQRGCDPAAEAVPGHQTAVPQGHRPVPAIEEKTAYSGGLFDSCEGTTTLS